MVSESIANQEESGLKKRTREILNTITEKVLRPYGFNDVSDLAWKKFDSHGQKKSVVVVGEVSRGKSALANALVGVKNATPEGVDFTTATAVALGPENNSLPAGKAQLFFSDGHEIINHRELGSWISRENQTIHFKNKDNIPTRAYVALSHSEMGDALVIDTPGVGGLDQEHADLAQSSVEQACVLVIAVDSSTEITAPEMAFIKQASAHNDFVIVAVTKTDKNTTRWHEIVKKDSELLLEHTGRDIPVIGVSSLLATYTGGDNSAEDLRKIQELSGIAVLRKAIEDRFQNAEYLPLINALRIVSGGLQSLHKKLQGELEILQAGKAAIPELSEELDTLKKLRQELERWEQYLQRDLTHLRQKSLDALETDLDDIRNKWTEQINKQGMAVLRKDPQYFTAQMEKDFQAAVMKCLGIFTDGLENEIVKNRFGTDVIWDQVQLDITQSLEDKTLHTANVRDKKDGVFDPMMIMMGFSGGSAILGGLGSLLGIAAASLTGVGAIAGVGWVAFNAGFRAMRSGKNNLLAWLRESIGTTKVFANRVLDATIANARPTIVIHYRTHLKEEIEATQQKIRDAERASQSDKLKREKNAERLKKNMAVILKKEQQIEQLIDELRTQNTRQMQKAGH